MEPAQSNDCDSASQEDSALVGSDLDSVAELDSLRDGFEFASCVARLERRWPSPKIPSTIVPVLQRIGRFEIRKELGRGRFGVVFLAWDSQLQRQVALKVPQFDAALDPELRERFRGEALAAAKLRHPGIVGLYEVGQQAGVDYLAMAYVEGITLAQRLKTGPLPAREASLVVSKLADAVQHAHEQGVIHRDLKPSNVLLDGSGDPLIMDFGLARRLSESAMRATATGQVLGTPAYMPPEQATGNSDIRATSDVYSLGVILYESLVGHPPFQAATFVEAVEFILNREPIPPSRLNPKLPRELDAIALKCLEKSPTSRYPTAAALAEDLENYLDGRPIRARSQGPLQRSVRWCRKNPSRALLLVASCLAIVLLGVTATIYERLQRTSELASQASRVARAERYFAELNRARNVAARRQPGWTVTSLVKLESAAKSESGVEDAGELRSLASDCLGGFDLLADGDLDAGMLVARIAFSPDGSLLAAGELKGNASCRIMLFDVASRKLKNTFTLVQIDVNLARVLSGNKIWQDGIREFAFSPDGKHLAASLRFGTVYVLSLEDFAATPLRLTVKDNRELTKLAFSSDGQSLWGLTKDHQLIQWADWQQETKPQTVFDRRQRSFAIAPRADRLFVQEHNHHHLQMLNQHLQPIGRHSELANLPRGPEGSLVTDSQGRLLAGNDGQGPKVYDTETGYIMRRLPDDAIADENLIDELSMSADGQLLVAFDYQGMARVFDVSASKQVISLVLGRHDFQDVALDPLGRRLAAVSNGELRFWRVSQGRCRRTLNTVGDPVRDLAFSPDGEELLCAVNNGTIHAQYRSSLLRYGCLSGKLRQRIDGGLSSLQFDPNAAQVMWLGAGDHAVWSGAFGTLCMRQTRGHELVSEQAIPVNSVVLPSKLAEIGSESHLAPGEAWTCAGDKTEGKLRLLLPREVPQGQHVPILLLSAEVALKKPCVQPFHVDIHIPGHDNVSSQPPTWLDGSHGDVPQPWAIQLPTSCFGCTELVLSFHVSPELDRLAIHRAEVVLLAKSISDAALPTTRVLDHLCMTAGSRFLWVQSDNEALAWDWPEVKQLTSWTNPQHQFTQAGNIRCVVTLDEFAFAGTRDGRIHRLSEKSDKSVHSWRGPGSEIIALEPCPQAGLLLAAGDNGTVRGYEVPSGNVHFDLPAAEEAVLAIAATPDAEWLAISTIDRQLKLWRRSGATYELFCQLPDVSSVVRELEFSPTGKYLAVLGNSSGIVELWNIQDLKREFTNLGIEQ